MVAPFGTCAWRSTRCVILMPRRGSGSPLARLMAGLYSSSTPSNAAVISLVMSSVVGPRPPVTSTISACANESIKASRIASPSGTAIWRWTRSPSGKSPLARNPRCVLVILPSRISVPVLMISTFISAPVEAVNPFRHPLRLYFLTLVLKNVEEVCQHAPEHRPGAGDLHMLGAENEVLAREDRIAIAECNDAAVLIRIE